MPMKVRRPFLSAFKRHPRGKKATTKKKINLLKRISTRLMTKQSFEEDYDNADSSQTFEDSGYHSSPFTHKRFRCGGNVYQVLDMSSCSSSCSCFQDQFETIPESKKARALILRNFVNDSSRHDIYALRSLLSNPELRWEKLQLVDAVPVSNCRRWRYKKDNIAHHIKDICKDGNIALDFEGVLELNVDDLSTMESVMNTLKQVEMDYEITTLKVTGRLNGDQLGELFHDLTNLLAREDRVWERVRLALVFGGDDPMQFQRWHQTMEQYRGLFAQIELQYGVPIELVKAGAPCAVFNRQ